MPPLKEMVVQSRIGRAHTIAQKLSFDSSLSPVRTAEIYSFILSRSVDWVYFLRRTLIESVKLGMLLVYLGFLRAMAFALVGEVFYNNF